MGAQLDRVLAYLDRDGVTELVIGVGRPLSLRRGVELVLITASPVTRGQFVTLVGDTPLASLVARGEIAVTEVEIGARRLKIAVERHGDDLVLLIAPAPSARIGSAPRARPPSEAPPMRARGKSVAPPPSGLERATLSPRPRNRSVAPPMRAPLPAVAPTRSRAKSAAPPMGGFGANALDDLDLARPSSGGAHPEPALSLDVDPSPSTHAGAPPVAAVSMASVELGIDIDLGTMSGGARTSNPDGLPPSPPRALPLSLDFDPLRSASSPPPVAAPLAAVLDLSLDVEPSSASIDFEPAAPARPRSPVTAVAPVVPRAGTFPRELAALVAQAQQRGASDLHVATGRVTSIRCLGELVAIDGRARPTTADEVDTLLGPLIAPYRAQLAAAGYIDLAIESPMGSRLRTNVSRSQSGLKATFRIAHAVPPTLAELGLPEELEKVIHHHQGLVVIAGPSGHGKTTTLAALVDRINEARAFHIITVEDPVEIVYPRKAAVVSQREVGPHTASFAAALKGSLREDPDVIVIGELRDRETVEIALTAAETGHLVLATMSTPSAAKTIDRLVDMFPPDDQAQVRASISGALRAIVAQRLLPAASGTRMVAAIELLTGCVPLANMIRDDKLYQLPNLMQRGRAFGMIRLDDSLIELTRSGTITAEAAIAASDNKRELATALQAPAAPPPRTDPPRGGGLFGRRGRE